jgi:membrane glycosyltransferase
MAILLPVYNEDSTRIAAGVRAVADGLADRLAGGSPGDFAFFPLSDTNDPEV